MASIKAYQKPDGTLVVTIHAKGKERKLLDVYGCALNMPASEIDIKDEDSFLGRQITIEYVIPLPAELAESLKKRTKKIQDKNLQPEQEKVTLSFKCHKCGQISEALVPKAYGAEIAVDCTHCTSLYNGSEVATINMVEIKK